MRKGGIIVSLLVIACSLATPTISSAQDYRALFQPVARGDQSTESIYFVMTDRFANGDTTNDLAGLTGAGDAGFDPTDIGYWHGGDFKGLTAHLDYIKNMGFTAIWITPPVKQQYVQGNSSAYHGYWGLDFLNVDPHLGTNADFKEFVDQTHQRGMKVILDVVANHTADVTQYAGKKAFIPKGKERLKNPAFLNKLNNYHNQGQSTFQGESALLGDFGGLDDLATEKPEVVQGFIDIWSYWINNFGIDGLRIDTFKHVNPEFWKKVIPSIQKVAVKAGKKSFPIFGEVFETGPEVLSTYITSGQTPSVLDFGFSDQMFRYAGGFGGADKLAAFFNLDDLYTTANTSAYGLATFVGNHDMGRIGTAILNNSSDTATALKRDLITQSALLLLRGGPVFYYGDEKGMTGGGGDKLARQDMFPTAVSRWQYEQRIGSAPIGESSSFDLVNPIETHIATIQQIVAANPALRAGTQQTLAAQGQLFVVSRYAQQQEYIVGFNTNDSEKSAKINPINKDGKWEILAGDCSIDNGESIRITGNSFCLAKAQSLITKSASTSIAAPKISASNDSPLWNQISTTVNAPGYNEVTFLAREKGGKWRSLGTSDHTTFQTSLTTGNRYRVFLHPELFKKKAVLELMAVMKNSDGTIISSPIGLARNS